MAALEQRFPRLANALAEDRLVGYGLPVPGTRTLRYPESSEHEHNGQRCTRWHADALDLLDEVED